VVFISQKCLSLHPIINRAHTEQRLRVVKQVHTTPVSAPFKLYKSFECGGRIEIIEGYKKRSDHRDLISIAIDCAKKGHIVQMPTQIHYKDAKYRQVFGALMGTKYERKCPDLIIDGMFYEYESFAPPFKKDKISNMLSHGLKQSSRVIINNNKGGKTMYIGRNVNNRVVNDHQNIDEIWLYEKGQINLLYKKK
jgi:hypothetical protein